MTSTVNPIMWFEGYWDGMKSEVGGKGAVSYTHLRAHET